MAIDHDPTLDQEQHYQPPQGDIPQPVPDLPAQAEQQTAPPTPGDQSESLPADTTPEAPPATTPSTIEIAAPSPGIPEARGRHFSKEASPRSSRRRGWRAAAGVAALAAVVGGAFVATSGGDSEETDRVVAEAPLAPDTPNVTSDTPATVEAPPTTQEAAPVHPYGVIAYEEIEPLLTPDDSFTIQRLNGEEIRLPFLRSADSTEVTVNKTMALLSGYMTTGNPEVLDALTGNPVPEDPNYGFIIQVRNLLEGWYHQYTELPQQDNPNQDLSGVQYIGFDSKEDPAVFHTTFLDSGGIFITLDSGALTWGAFIGQDFDGTEDNEWQDTRFMDDPRTIPREYRVSSLKLTFEPVGDISLELTGLELLRDRAESNPDNGF